MRLPLLDCAQINLILLILLFLFFIVYVFKNYLHYFSGPLQLQLF